MPTVEGWYAKNFFFRSEFGLKGLVLVPLVWIHIRAPAIKIIKDYSCFNYRKWLQLLINKSTHFLRPLWFGFFHFFPSGRVEKGQKRGVCSCKLMLATCAEGYFRKKSGIAPGRGFRMSNISLKVHLHLGHRSGPSVWIFIGCTV